MKAREHKQFDVGQTVYWTKYALSLGIKAHTIKVKCITPGWWMVVGSHDLFKEGDLFATLDAAQQRARQMALSALKSLAKRRAQLESVARMGAKVST